ncbi:MAG TPA: RsmE family RNA methyltransferase [Kiritimatiellia bacterium]|nr:RsmE family RNA methyltransferase [Kiritimatiellia bacterium]
MNCILIDRNDISGATIMLGPRESKHIAQVLKKSPGESILAGIVDGPIGMTKIVSMHQGVVEVELPEGPTPPHPPLDIVLAMPRPKVMKRLWAPMASLGVRQITIIGAERVESFYFESHATYPAIYIPRLREGLEQARDTRMPEVKMLESFSWFASHHLPKIPADHVKLIADPNAGESVRDVMNKHEKPGNVTLAIGPEGGWAQKEIDAFHQNGFLPVGMGRRTLRTDTAVAALMALVYSAL